MKNIYQFILVSFVLILSSCSKQNLMKYYFPLNQKSKIKVYQYVNPKDKSLNEYWTVMTDPVKKTITTKSMDADFGMYNWFEEKIGTDKAELLAYADYGKRGKWNVKLFDAEVKKNQVYASNKKKSYAYSVEYKSKNGRVLFEKKRQFLKIEEIKVQGKSYKTAKFKDEYFFNELDNNEKYEFYQYAYYAEGIGMVKYERYLPNGEVRVLELSNILSEIQFQLLMKKKKR